MIIRNNIEISKPKEIVFPWIAEPEKAMQWQKNVKSGTIITKKPEMVGTTFEEEIEENGKTLKIRGVIKEFKDNRAIGFCLESKIHTVNVTYSIEENDKISTVHADINIKWKFPMSIISIFLGKRIKNNISKQLGSEFLELKTLCEA